MSGRLANAALIGVIAGLIVGFIIFLVDKASGYTISPFLWGVIVGVLVGIVAYTNNRKANL